MQCECPRDYTCSDIIHLFNVLDKANFQPTKGLQMLSFCLEKYGEDVRSRIKEIVRDFELQYVNLTGKHLELEVAEPPVLEDFILFLMEKRDVFLTLETVFLFINIILHQIYPNLTQCLNFEPS